MTHQSKSFATIPLATIPFILGIALSLTPARAAQPTTQPTFSFPICGVALQPPALWIRLGADRAGIVTRWISPGSTAGHVQGMIMVEMKKPRILDAAQIAAGYAKNWGGKVDDQQTSLDGEPAWHIVGSPALDLDRPAESIITIRQGRLYLIEGGVTPGHTCHNEIETIRRSWKWLPMEPTIKHLELSDAPGTLFNGQVSVKYPIAMYTYDDKDPNSEMGLALMNYAADRDDFEVILKYGTLPDGLTLAGAQKALTTGIQDKFNLPEAFVWRKVTTTSTDASITQAVQLPNIDDKAWIAWGIVGLPQNRFVLANFTILAENPRDRAAYSDLAEKMIQSIAPAAATP